MANEFEISDTLFEVLKAREIEASNESPREEYADGHAEAIALIANSEAMTVEEIAKLTRNGDAAIRSIMRAVGFERPSLAFREGFTDGLRDVYHSYQRRKNATPH